MFTLTRHQLFFMVLIIQIISEGWATSISEKTKNEILSQFDITDHSLQQFINIFSDDSAESTATSEPETLHRRVDAMKSPSSDDSAESTATSEPETLHRRVYAMKSPSSFAASAGCAISRDKLTELKAEINTILSKPKTTSTNANCQYDFNDTNNCKELMKLIQCGVSHVKNGFLKAVNDNNSKEEALKWKNAFDSLSRKYQKELDNMFHTFTEKTKQQADDSKKELQKLQRAFDQISDNLKEAKDECLPTKYCLFDFQSYFSNDLGRFLKICKVVPELISNIRYGEISAAISKFNEQKDNWIPAEIFEEVVAILYKQEGEDNLDNIIRFATSVEWYTHRVYFMRRLAEEMKKNQDVACHRWKKLIEAIDRLVDDNQYSTSRMNSGEEKDPNEQRPMVIYCFFGSFFRDAERLAKEVQEVHQEKCIS